MLKFTGKNRRTITAFVLAIAFCVLLSIRSVYSQPPDTSNLPTARVHPLPLSLNAVENKAGNYFEQIESTPLGYLVWSNLPIKVYVESIEPQPTAANQRFQKWTAAAQRAIAEWNVYLPLKEVAVRDKADIIILRSQPDREVKLNPDTGLYDIPRAVAAQTNYEFYLTEKPSAIAMRMRIEVSSSFTGVSLSATMRHELGHALGIWGHSPNRGDALYFSQVSNPPAISGRDVNTLRKIYQQPTRLGWKIK